MTRAKQDTRPCQFRDGTTATVRRLVCKCGYATRWYYWESRAAMRDEAAGHVCRNVKNEWQNEGA